MKNWQLSNIPDMTGKIALVTGGNVGLGFKSALELARNGAEIVIACRRPDSAEQAIERLRQAVPSAALSPLPLDLSDLASVRACVEAFAARHDRLDILLNNAGVVNLEALQRTPDGHEMHMAVNHYGHFALTVGLFPVIAGTPHARVVTVSSLAARSGEIRFDDMAWRSRPYDRLKAYGESKLANLLFTRALQSRFEVAGSSALSVAAHPGLTGTERQQSIGVGGKLSKWLASPVAVGVAPQLRAAADPSVKGRDFFGPKFNLRGPAVNIAMKGEATNEALAEELWQHMADVTGVALD